MEELKIFRKPNTFNKGKPTSYIWICQIGEYEFYENTFEELIDAIKDFDKE